ncbi:hypothetical protein ACP70R_007671 [Stipagrostis hirtigluma subsp. patula]
MGTWDEASPQTIFRMSGDGSQAAFRIADGRADIHADDDGLGVGVGLGARQQRFRRNDDAGGRSESAAAAAAEGRRY